MAFSFFLSITSLAFLIILIMTFFSKELIKTTSSKFFRVLIMLCLLFILTEILSVVISKYIKLTILTVIIFRLHCGIGFLWIGALYMYAISKYKDLKNESIIDTLKYSKNEIIYTIIIGVSLLIALFMPYETINAEKLQFFPFELMMVAIPYYLFIDISILVLFFKKDDKSFKKTILLAIAFSIVGFALQVFYRNISFIPFMGVVIVYLIYFIIENPDLAILGEISDSQENIIKSNQAKTDFLSNMSYEIKIPMNLIISLCDELNNMPNYDPNEVKNCMKQIVDAGNNLLDIINNILDISKIETGKETLIEADYKINDILSNVINIAKQKIGSKPVKLLINIDQSTSSVLHGDSSKLYQALLNVVTNAAKYTEVGRITITLSSSRNGGNEHLLFKVTDTGIGIKPEDKDKVYIKHAAEDKDEGDGAGLGLVITKQYVESMGGKIWFESEYHVGTTFFIEVEQKIIDATPLGSAVTNEVAESNEKLDCSQFKVLIVDDNLLNIKVAKRLLENYKFQVESVTSGKECVDKIKEEEKYDAIFMDHMMPEMDGIETLHVLKKLDGYTLPPIIALTANAIAGMKEMYLNEGFDDYLAKPINTHELDRIINKFFKK